MLTKATVTSDRTISGSYNWLRLDQGATDRQCLLRSRAAVAYVDRSLSVVALSRTIGEYRWLETSYEIVRLLVAITDRCTISYCAKRPIVQSIVATDRRINRDGRRPMVRSIVASYDRSYEKSWHPAYDRSYEHSWSPVTERTINGGTRRPIVRSMV